MYYGLIIIAVVLFVLCFALNDEYQKRQGNGLRSSLKFTFESSLAGLLVLLLINSFKFEFTWFSFLLAIAAYLVNVGFTFCGFKALGSINLSLYSLFSMLGGMALPFLQGIIFYNEDITIAKGLCFVFITIALFLTAEKGTGKKGSIYYIGIFILNGMAGVISTIFAASSFEKTSVAGYSVLCAIVSTVMSAVMLLFFAKRKEMKEKFSFMTTIIGSANGVVNRIANFLLIIALMNVDASVQYPLVTGGVMILSTFLCFFRSNKPKKKEILSVIIAFIGTLILFVVPV